MKKFKFKLEKLENSKQHFKQQKAFKLAEKIRLLESEKLKLKKLLVLETKLLVEMKSKKVFHAAEMLSYRGYLDQVGRSVKVQEKRLANAVNEVDRARAELKKVSREKKILEKLHEKKHREYVDEFNREDQKFIDELATQRKARVKWQLQTI